MKKLLGLFLIVLVSCTQRIGDFTILSTKNYEATVKYKFVGRFSGEERVFFFIIPWGIPNIKNATDRAIEHGGGVYLTNAVLESVNGLFQIGYNITGDVYAPVTQGDLLDPSIELFEAKILDGKLTLISSSKMLEVYNPY